MKCCCCALESDDNCVTCAIDLVANFLILNDHPMSYAYTQ